MKVHPCEEAKTAAHKNQILAVFQVTTKNAFLPVERVYSMNMYS